MPEKRNRSSGNGGNYRSRYNRDPDDDFRFEIVESIGVIATSGSGWSKELNRVSWNGNDPKYDIREWSPDHARMRRGITFTDEEALELKDLLDFALGAGSSDLLSGQDDFHRSAELTEGMQELSA